MEYPPAVGDDNEQLGDGRTYRARKKSDELILIFVMIHYRKPNMVCLQFSLDTNPMIIFSGTPRHGYFFSPLFRIVYIEKKYRVTS